MPEPEILHFKRSDMSEVHVCQSRVEIEYYFVAYFDRVTAFKASYLRTFVKGGAQTRCVIASIVAAFTQRV